MYVSLSIMKPNPSHERDTEDSMRRFAAAARTQEGLILCSTFRDTDSADLFGIAIWESPESAQAAGPALMAAVGDDDFETWVKEMQNYRLTEV
jgi:hypothetical protein